MYELRRAGGVGVNVAHDVQAVLAGLAYQPQHLRDGLAPIASAYGLEVAYFERHPELTGHGQHLAQGVHNPVALLAHVHGHDGFRAAQGLKRTYEALSVVKALRRIAEAERDAYRSPSQRFLQQPVYTGILLSCERKVRKTGGTGAYRTHPGEHERVDRRRCLARLGQV